MRLRYQAILDGHDYSIIRIVSLEWNLFEDQWESWYCAKEVPVATGAAPLSSSPTPPLELRIEATVELAEHTLPITLFRTRRSGSSVPNEYPCRLAEQIILTHGEVLQAWQNPRFQKQRQWEKVMTTPVQTTTTRTSTGSTPPPKTADELWRAWSAYYDDDLFQDFLYRYAREEKSRCQLARSSQRTCQQWKPSADRTQVTNTDNECSFQRGHCLDEAHEEVVRNWRGSTYVKRTVASEQAEKDVALLRGESLWLQRMDRFETAKEALAQDEANTTGWRQELVRAHQAQTGRVELSEVQKAFILENYELAKAFVLEVVKEGLEHFALTLPLRSGEQVTSQVQLLPGDHISVSGGFGYEAVEHHGIFVGARNNEADDAYVIDVGGAPTAGLCRSLASLAKRGSLPLLINFKALSKFRAKKGPSSIEPGGGGHQVGGTTTFHNMTLLQYTRRRDRLETLLIALASIGSFDYGIFSRNCEHWAAWAASGQWQSQQIRKITVPLLALWTRPLQPREDLSFSTLKNERMPIKSACTINEDPSGAAVTCPSQPGSEKVSITCRNARGTVQRRCVSQRQWLSSLKKQDSGGALVDPLLGGSLSKTFVRTLQAPVQVVARRR